MIVYVPGSARGLGGRVDRPGGGSPGDGAAVEPRLLDAGRRRRGEIPSDLKRKVVNDAAKSLRAIAEEHGRNGDWAEQAVRVASNLTAREALEMNVIDEIAPTLPALLNKIDGERTTTPKNLVLHTANAEQTEVKMSLWKRILDTVIDPNIVVLLMSLGLLGITIELYSPGLILPGTVGVTSLILGLFGRRCCRRTGPGCC